MRRSNAPTLQDVAREAGVTAMTVSAVLNGGRSGTRVSDATRIRVEEVAARLRYRTNAVARGLSRRRMDTLGVAAVIDGGEINLYFLEVLNGILEAAARHGQNATIFSVSDWTQDEQKILQFCDGRVDGMIFIAPQIGKQSAETLAHHAPFVTIHGAEALPNIHNLEVDNEAGAYAAVHFLTVQGHRRIAHFTGGLDLHGAQMRFAGYRRALSDAGIAFDESLILRGAFNSASGRQRMTDLLGRPGPIPTAIFCASDAIAYGCMETIAERGLRVPEDISIAGFDDLMLARMTTPNLTTIRQPFRQMGRRAVDLLLEQINHGISDESAIPVPATTDIFAVELIVRQSVGQPPH